MRTIEQPITVDVTRERASLQEQSYETYRRMLKPKKTPWLLYVVLVEEVILAIGLYYVWSQS